MTFRYPHARTVVLALCPGNDVITPLFGAVPSVSASRMNSLVPDWRERACGANAWWTQAEHAIRAPSHVKQIIRETGCQTIVALGREVHRELSVKGGRWCTWRHIQHRGEAIRVLLLPHPSGLNRYWNSPENCRAAESALRVALGL